jgi:hypothetical protein
MRKGFGLIELIDDSMRRPAVQQCGAAMDAILRLTPREIASP